MNREGRLIRIGAKVSLLAMVVGCSASHLDGDLTRGPLLVYAVEGSHVENLGDDSGKSRFIGQISRRLDRFGFSPHITQKEGGGKWQFEIHTSRNQLEACARIIQEGRACLYEVAPWEVHEEWSRGGSSNQSAPKGCQILKIESRAMRISADTDTILVMNSPFVTHHQIMAARALRRPIADADGETRWDVEVVLNEQGNKMVGELSKRLARAQGRIAVVIDQRLVSIPLVMAPVSGRFELGAHLTETEAIRVANLLDTPIDLDLRRLK